MPSICLVVRTLRRSLPLDAMARSIQMHRVSEGKQYVGKSLDIPLTKDLRTIWIIRSNAALFAST